MACERPFFAGSVNNADALIRLGKCDAPVRYRTRIAVMLLPNPEAKYRERLPRVPGEHVLDTCGKHVVARLTGAQQRVLDRTGRVALPGVVVEVIE